MDNNNIKISFDFDGTLDRPAIQNYFKELRSRGYDVWVVTRRYDDLNKHRYIYNSTNEDLWAIIDSLEHPREKVMFTNYEYKDSYLKNTHVKIHIDDDPVELSKLENNTKIRTINATLNNWTTCFENTLKHFK